MSGYTYKAAFNALCIVSEVPEDRQNAFSGRLKSLAVLGIAPSSPGKGKRISYAFEDVFALAVCIQFEWMGMSPKMVVEIVKSVQGSDELAFREHLIYRPRLAAGAGVAVEFSDDLTSLAGTYGMIAIGHLRRSLAEALAR